jgi:dTDP-4-amino-4,6-dideoxygalactose transaminase
MASYKDRPLATIGHLAAISFHETKNLISGEGGALIVNDPRFIARAEIIREKGTNRSQFFRGEADKYTWLDIGSSYLPSDTIAAFLLAQFEQADRLAEERWTLWQRYHDGLADLERRNKLRRPYVPQECGHNAHLYAIRLRDQREREAMIAYLRSLGIGAPFHYVPLHSAPAGRRFARSVGDLPVTVSEAAKLVRLPLWYGMGEDRVEQVLAAIHGFFEDHRV